MNDRQVKIIRENAQDDTIVIVPDSFNESAETAGGLNESAFHRMVTEELYEARKKGKSVVKKGGKKASAGSIAIFKKAAKKAKGGEAKKKRAGFDAVKKSAEKWGAEDPAAVAQATTMVAAGEPVVSKGEKRKLKEAFDLYEELLESLTPRQIAILESRR